MNFGRIATILLTLSPAALLAQAPAPPNRPASLARPPPASATTPPAAATPTPARLPNGASSITETFGDWTVSCRIEAGVKVCALSQAQGDAQGGQRRFGIELGPTRDGRLDGIVLMPFGLRLDNGAVLKLDARDLGQGLRFSTCVAQGCLLPISLPTVATDAMKTAKRLTVASLAQGNNEVVIFDISLDGFAPALARLDDLAGPA